ncbi:MAG: Rieske 2Fe-2S domain-containing protein [Cyclobacteriaceae bacterium]|nr:Rieske 2Fe-2S domain-containing protein [Cyclobacteriaceae bacterium]
MSASYKAILWNRYKKMYDWVLLGFVLIYLLLFISITLVANPEVTQETLIIRAFGSLAILLLHIILMIGPLARLNSAFLPILYNRRHLGVTMFCMAAIHGIFSIIQFHSLGNINPIVSVFLSNTHYESFTKFPFEAFGFLALVILFLMAITSHDFWLHNLSPRVWKTLHMMVYVAYTLIILHVLLGVLQFETSPMFFSLLGLGMTSIITLHLISGSKEYKKDKAIENVNGFVRICSVSEIEEKRAKVVCLQDERIAIFKYDQKISAISNVCKHQNGPLGEGRIIDGCITCPWHGYQYLPHNGSSPPPFKEKVVTYQVKVIDDEVWVNPKPFAEGTTLEPAKIIN